MKKAILNPLELDKKTIALLDAAQLQSVTGGLATDTTPSSSSGGGKSTGCGSGSSQCRAISGN